MTKQETTYKELSEKLNKPVQDFINKHAFWAFNETQLNEKLKKLGITKEQLQKDYIPFFGGVIKKDKVREYRKMSNKATSDLIEALKANFNLAKDAFNYEFNNHECFYTGRFSEALNAIGLTIKEVNENETLLKAFKEAKNDYWEWACENC